MTSPWLREPRAQTVSWLTEFFRNRTEPSAIRNVGPARMIATHPEEAI